MNCILSAGRRISVIMFLLVAISCTAQQKTLSLSTPTPASSVETEATIKQWIAAWESRDAEKYMATFAPDGEIMFAPEPGALYAGPTKVQDLVGTIRENFASKQIHVKSYFISADGQSAAAEGTFTMDGKTGPTVTVPVAFILRFKDGKISREILYYDGSPFY